MSEQHFSIDQLCSLTAVPKRTVRYYIQIGLLDRPVGETRGAHYLSTHLETLLRIKQLSDAGVSLERIRQVLGGEPPILPPRQRQPGDVDVRSHVWIAPGVELQLSPEEAQISQEQLRALLQAVLDAWNQIKEKP